LHSFIKNEHFLGILKEKSEKSGTIFFLFYVFRELKAELISEGLRDKA
jgi:hypothetical protein